MNNFIARNGLYITLPAYNKRGIKHSVLIDLVHYDLLRRFELTVAENGYVYIWISIFPQPIYLHRLIRKCPPGYVIDHVGGWKRDCRLYSLRVITPEQNKFNKFPYNKFFNAE